MVANNQSFWCGSNCVMLFCRYAHLYTCVCLQAGPYNPPDVVIKPTTCRQAMVFKGQYIYV
jgi:hypothetical protein